MRHNIHFCTSHLEPPRQRGDLVVSVLDLPLQPLAFPHRVGQPAHSRGSARQQRHLSPAARAAGPGGARSPDVELASLGVRPGLEVHHVGHSRSELLLQLKPEALLPLQGQGGAALLAVQSGGQAGAGHLDGVGRPRQLVPHVRQVPAMGRCCR